MSESTGASEHPGHNVLTGTPCPYSVRPPAKGLTLLPKSMRPRCRRSRDAGTHRPVGGGKEYTAGENRAMRAVAYLRVSSAGQVDGHSLDAESRLLHDLCRGRDWEAAGVYREEGRSAHSESIKKRPVFRQLLDDAGKGMFDAVVVHTLDCWSRNLRVTLESLKTLAQHNIGLVSISENIDYSTPQGKLFTQMLGSFAEYFSESLATHVGKGQSQRAAEGRHLRRGPVRL